VVPYRGGGDNAANATLAARLRRRLGAQLGRDCDADDAATFDTVEPLTAKQALVGLHCSRGAYNYWSRWYVVTDRNVQAARAALFLDHPAAKARKDDSYLVNGGYDASTGRFGAFSKGRGLGDCGSFSEWGWDGARFLLIERREYYECRGGERRLVAGDLARERANTVARRGRAARSRVNHPRMKRPSRSPRCTHDSTDRCGAQHDRCAPSTTD
jgi:hypothetical protein